MKKGHSGRVKHVLLLSIDGVHGVDFYNCAHGIAGVNGGDPYCPHMAALSETAINYVNALSSKPKFSQQTVSSEAAISQVAPTILEALGFDPSLLDAVRIEGTPVLPEVAKQLPR